MAERDKKPQMCHQVVTHPELEERIEKVEVVTEVTQASATDLQPAYLEHTTGLV